MLVDYARKELELAGLLDKDSDYNGKVGVDVLELIDVFAHQGHSGFSAAMTVEVLQSCFMKSYSQSTPH